MRKAIAVFLLLAGALLLAAPAWAGPPKHIVRRIVVPGYPVCLSKAALRQAIALGRAGTGGGFERITSGYPCLRMDGQALFVDKEELWGWWIRAWSHYAWSPEHTTYYVQPEALLQGPEPDPPKPEKRVNPAEAFD